MHDPISSSFNHYRAKIKWIYVCMYAKRRHFGLRDVNIIARELDNR